jgi:hypothetical protein
MDKKNRFVHFFIIGIFTILYFSVSIISTIHVIDFFTLTNSYWLALSLAIAFEMGAAASLASIIVMDKMNKFLVWSLFITLTSFQMMGNMYFAYSNAKDFQGWIELFGLIDYDIIMQKRILSIVSGAILPLVALGFIKSLVDYLKPEAATVNKDIINEPVLEPNPIDSDLNNEIKNDVVENVVETNESAIPVQIEDDPQFKKIKDEYINKTKTIPPRNIKTIPGISH